jgi:hypothetical protein
VRYQAVTRQLCRASFPRTPQAAPAQSRRYVGIDAVAALSGRRLPSLRSPACCAGYLLLLLLTLPAGLNIANSVRSAGRGELVDVDIAVMRGFAQRPGTSVPGRTVVHPSGRALRVSTNFFTLELA